MEDLSDYSMLELFRLEADAQTALLSAAVLALEDAGRSPPDFESMMRAAHSLKGAARIIGLDPAVRVAHALEEVFVEAGKGLLVIDTKHADALLAAIDFLAEIGRVDQMPEADDPWSSRADMLVARLLQTASAGREPAPLHSVTGPVPLETAAAPPPRSDVSASPHPEPAVMSDRVVRISSVRLTRLMALVGEALVESRHLQPLVRELTAVRAAQATIGHSLAAFEVRIGQRGSGIPHQDSVALADIRRQYRQLLDDLTRSVDAIGEFARRSEHVADALHREAIASRLRPFADGIRELPRLVRDVARSLGKQVRLEVRGEKTGVDRDILDKLEAPLCHLIRNAIDHGIETPDRRQEVGKSASGTILLEAAHQAGMLTITVSDDGRGVDLEYLRHEATERGLVTPALAEQLSVAELLEFLFLPGFTTRKHVSEMSGRGVGLDAVRGMAKAVGGNVRVTTQPGGWTCFTLQLPVSMSVIRAILVEIGGEPYAFPLARIDRIVTCTEDDVRTVEGKHYVDCNGEAVGLVAAAEVLDVGPPSEGMPVPLCVVVIGGRGQQFGLIVDRILGEHDVEVRPLDTRFGSVPDVAAASVLANGDPVLILDVEEMLTSIDAMLAGRRLARLAFARSKARIGQRKRVLLVDDSITVRELERKLLRDRGFDADVAIDGLEGWNAVREGEYDLVVSDVDMPRLDGIELVSRMKADPNLRDIPVVIVSYKDLEEDRLRGLDAGANRYLTKASFHDDSFVNTIVDLIGEPEE